MGDPWLVLVRFTVSGPQPWPGPKVKPTVGGSITVIVLLSVSVQPGPEVAINVTVYVPVDA